MPKWAPVDDMSNYYNAYRPQGEKAWSLLARRPILTITAVLGTLLLLIWHQSSTSVRVSPVATVDRRVEFDGRWDFARDRNNLLLDDSQCDVAFPKLFEEVDRAVSTRSRNHITSNELDAITPKNGYVRAMIYDQEVLHKRHHRY